MRIRMNRWTALCLLLACGAAAADDAPSIEGNWKIGGRSNRGGTINGALMIKGATGTWFTQGGGGVTKDTCLGREYPIEVQSVDEKTLVLIVKRDATLKGCADMTVTLRRSGPELLENGSADGAHLAIHR